MIQITLVSLVLSSLISAHVKLYYYPMQMPIRNAPGATSDGAFSTGGICGGKPTLQWGAQHYSEVSDGQTVCGRLNFNGGHTTVQYAYIQAVFMCGAPQQQDFSNYIEQLQALTLVNGTDPPPDASGLQVDASELNQRYQGYTVCVNLPFQNITDSMTYTQNENLCSLAIMSYMQGDLLWGGCLDFIVRQSYLAYPNEILYPVMTMAPTLPVSLDYALPINLTEASGVYKIFSCDTTSGGSCCFEGYLGVGPSGAVSLRVRGTTSACLQLFNIVTDYQFTLVRSPYAANAYLGNVYINIGVDQYGRQYEIQNISVSIQDVDVNSVMSGLYMSNVGLSQPYIADHTAVYSVPLQTGVDLGLVPYPTGVNPVDYTTWIIVAIVIFMVLAYLIGGVAYNVVKGNGWYHSHVRATLIGLGIINYNSSFHKSVRRQQDEGASAKVVDDPTPIKKKAGYSILLPEKWESAVDQSSGEVYYYNRESGEVRWERPSGV